LEVNKRLNEKKQKKEQLQKDFKIQKQLFTLEKALLLLNLAKNNFSKNEAKA
jgi:hypothetical protein